MKQLGKYLSAAVLSVTLISAVGCSSTPKQEGTGEYMDDSVITSKVKAAIFGDSMLKSAEINVETFKGVVQLSGFVSSQAARREASEDPAGRGAQGDANPDLRPSRTSSSIDSSRWVRISSSISSSSRRRWRIE
jgi:hyperosmotically inducible protein